MRIKLTRRKLYWTNAKTHAGPYHNGWSATLSVSGYWLFAINRNRGGSQSKPTLTIGSPWFFVMFIAEPLQNPTR